MLTALLATFDNDAQWIAFNVVCAILVILIFLVALFSVILVMLQKSNSDGIQGITASSETFFGKHKGRSIESTLKKLTWIMLGVIGVLAIAAYIIQIVIN
ncbi:MAG: preprotein translocase subunit SecG [Clostridiales bacterium]|nr:preprotein translocase subunit SecG [Clostridiales bacterium]